MFKKKNIAGILSLAIILAVTANSFAAESIKTEKVSIAVKKQHTQIIPGSKSALALEFQVKKDWHFYASPDIPAGGVNLKVVPNAPGTLVFSDPVFPPSESYFDKSTKLQVEVFSGNFTVYLPFTVVQIDAAEQNNIPVSIAVSGPLCSDIICTFPTFDNLTFDIEVDNKASMAEAAFDVPESQPKAEIQKTNFADFSVWFAFLLAFLAGLSLNIMPCVWPVLPIIVMRIIENAKHSKGRSIAMGLCLCLGIVLFFACLAGANIILQLVYGTVLQWGDQFRNPAFVAAMAVLLTVLALFMFNVFTFTVPSSVSGKTSSGTGYAGAAGMGFLAAILSTPCSFGILAAAFAWAQAQPLYLATLTILIMGLGMALPYLVLTSIPSLLKRLPKAGGWMELFKEACGFLLLGIAVWLIGALPQDLTMNVLFFMVVVSFCVWMWGSWVSFKTPALKKWIIRLIAVALAVLAGFSLFTPSDVKIDWLDYDAAKIENAIKNNQPVLIKFDASWCLSCKAVDMVVYSRKDIADLLEEKNVLTIKADTTTRDMPATSALKDKYKEPGIPVNIFIMPDGQEFRWRNKAFGDEFKSLLDKL